MFHMYYLVLDARPIGLYLIKFVSISLAYKHMNIFSCNNNLCFFRQTFSFFSEENRAMYILYPKTNWMPSQLNRVFRNVCPILLVQVFHAFSVFFNKDKTGENLCPPKILYK